MLSAFSTSARPAPTPVAHQGEAQIIVGVRQIVDARKAAPARPGPRESVLAARGSPQIRPGLRVMRVDRQRAPEAARLPHERILRLSRNAHREPAHQPGRDKRTIARTARSGFPVIHVSRAKMKKRPISSAVREGSGSAFEARSGFARSNGSRCPLRSASVSGTRLGRRSTGRWCRRTGILPASCRREPGRCIRYRLR